MTTRDDLNSMLLDYTKNQVTLCRDTIRLVLADVRNLEIETKHDATEEEITNIVKRLIKQTEETYNYSKTTDNNERTETLSAQISMLKSLLPAQLEGQELQEAIEDIIANNGYSSKKDIGAIMQSLTQETNGNFDRAFAGKFLNQRL